VQIATSSGANAQVVATVALAGLLALARRFPGLWAEQQVRQWIPMLGERMPRDLPGQTVTLVGWGPIGQKLGSLLQALGLHVVAHAGEEGPPAYIHSALDVLQVERIDHGVRCSEDPALVQRLKHSRMPLTVCPLSNVKLCVFDTLAQHNLATLLHEGLCITLNSDDPAYFGGYLLTNFEATFAALPALTVQDAWQLARNSFEASFASDAQKAAWMAELDAVFQAAA
jgi:hypothetical protein